MGYYGKRGGLLVAALRNSVLVFIEFVFPLKQNYLKLMLHFQSTRKVAKVYPSSLQLFLAWYEE